MFLPTTKEEMQKLGWEKPDIILVSGDVYIDSPFIGAAVIGNWLTAHGFKVAVIAQPDITTDDIARLGEPALFWGVSAGAMDSFVSNYTSLNKFRNDDDLTPGGINNRRPDRASMVYTNIIRKHFKNTKPIVLGGVEASLRRIVHYDFKDNDLRRSILFDAKADIISYGMGEKSMLELARNIKEGKDWRGIKGICYISKEKPENALEIPSFEECRDNKDKFFEAFASFYKNTCSKNEKILCQKHAERYLVQNPKQPALTSKELDEIYDLDYTREVHPYYAKLGKVKAQDTIKFSITTHRGCFGECNFCSIAVHQGKEVVSRSEESVLNEARKITKLKDFKGYITDLGGPTANMYKTQCKVNTNAGSCENKRCLFPKTCENLVAGHDKQIELLTKVSKIEGVKKVFISSGIRYDMICADVANGQNYLDTLLENNISGQMKIAPEHIDDKVLALMGKPNSAVLKHFIKMFQNSKSEKLRVKSEDTAEKKDSFPATALGNDKLSKLFLTYYFIAAYPGCGEAEMRALRGFINTNLKTRPEQIQIFTPTPSTIATMMYYTEKDLNGNKIFVEKDRNSKQKQKRIICA
ncbi:MAG: YgiQ family radical SAM protein [Endomicrobia bacterium]|nr:YgiQ family radical SAM protein [Endomicrobiia bacterium]MCL2799164.1 YgiQ family radical SAM protein [Endomicrobiia bacterium]